ncbi:hypothetical protein ACFSO0_06765 [Brevibacillus sp. GCM10020057]|uniref:hypothetical protein n=1 Tax=Brevibacillus sp. GCM10020057 TaxID=3317327 RepID=UPI003630A44B
MNKLIATLALLVLVLPLTVNLLLTGPDNLMSACTQFFGELLGSVTRYGAS